MPIDLHGFCCAGSDDGRVYIWDAKSGDVICALEADEDIVNSVAAHPSLPYLATSGIEDKVRIWGPHSSPVYQDLSEQIQRNQVGLLVYLAPYQQLAMPLLTKHLLLCIGDRSFYLLQRNDRQCNCLQTRHSGCHALPSHAEEHCSAVP